MRLTQSLTKTAAILAGVVAICGFLLGAWFFVDFISRAGADLERKALQSVASTAAAALETDQIAKLKGPGQDVRELPFRIVRAELQRVHAAFGGIRFVYLVGMRNSDLIFLADAESMQSADYSPPGQRYYEAPETFHRVFETGRPAIVGPYRDRWGTWTSGLAPVTDAKTKQVIAVIGVDVPAAAWQQEVGRYRMFALALVALIGALLFLFGLIASIQARARKRIAGLNGELREQVDQLALSNRIVENSSTVLFRIDLTDSTPLSYVSRNIEHYGYNAAELLAKPLLWRTLFHVEDRAAILSDIQRLSTGKAAKARRELRFMRADGSWAWIDGRLSVVHDMANRRVALEGIMYDISDAKKAEEQIAHLATHDPLTGLVNRPAFLERLQMAFAETKRSGALFAVLYLDVDHFKDVNDAFGHEKGDMLLKAIADRLSAALRETDLLGRFSVARFGGDEFAILQTAVSDASDCATLAKRLGKILSEPFALDGNDLHITVSCGISIYDASITEPKDMLMQADLALYRAKDAGRNQFHFHSSNLDTEVRERVAIGEDLHAALDNGELELHYQPQVEIPSGRIIGMEALIRWHHPKRGMIWPDVFIPIAEKSGIISSLGEWAIRKACSQITDWRNEGISVPTVGINVSAVQFRNPDGLMRAIESALSQSKIEGWKIELEMTESVLVETSRTHSDVLRRLRDLGLRIAVDDFGTGYSSLQYLRTYPINRIKIAQQFMHDVTGAGGDAAIVRAVIEMARALDLGIIAEGVETAAQATFLAQAGCHEIQGFYFSPPVNADAMAALLRAGKFAYPRAAERQRGAA